MKKIIFVTGNQSKINDAGRMFRGNGVMLVGQKLDLLEIQSLRQEEIVKFKAEQAYKILKKPLVVDDTAFYISSYNAFPGTLTRHVNSLLGLEGLTKLFDEGQKAYFLTYLCFTDGKNKVLTTGKLSGLLTKKVSPQFNSDMPISSVFIPEGHNKPLIELAKDGDMANLHRLYALKNLKRELSKYGY